HDARRPRHAGASPSDSAGVHRRGGGTVRLLPERRHPHREGVPRSASEGDRSGAAAGDVHGPVQLLHARADVESHQALCSGEGVMVTRRDFLKGSGALVVTFASAPLVERAGLAQGPFGTRASHIDPSQLDSWIAISADGRVTAYTGKCEIGQGILTAQTQLVAEELSVPLDRVTL